MRNHDRIRRYVVRWHMRNPHPWQDGPTVRDAAKALKLTNEDVENECAELPLMLTSHFHDTPIGNWFIEICE